MDRLSACSTVRTITRLAYYHTFMYVLVQSRGRRRVIRIGRPGAWCYLASCIRTAGVVVTFA